MLLFVLVWEVLLYCGLGKGGWLARGVGEVEGRRGVGVMGVLLLLLLWCVLDLCRRSSYFPKFAVDYTYNRMNTK